MSATSTITARSSKQTTAKTAKVARLGQRAEGSVKLQLDLAQRLAIGMRLTELREEKGLSQMQVAKQALGFKVSHAAVSRLERGVLDEVEGGRLAQLAEFYGETVESLLAELAAQPAEPSCIQSTDGMVVAPGYGDRLFQLRQALGCTAAEFAVKLGHPPAGAALIRDREAEKFTVRPDTLVSIAVTLGVSASWLILGKQTKVTVPTLPMRVNALQKLYGLSNREVSLLGEMDISTGWKTVHRICRAKHRPTAAEVQAVAKAFDVPAEWINPPVAGYEPPVPITYAPDHCAGLSPRATSFIKEMAELFSMAAVSDEQIGALRSQFMRELMSGLRPAKKSAALLREPKICA